MLDPLLQLLTDSPWTYVLLFGIAAGDAVFPALPSEAAMIVAGILAGTAGLDLGIVIAAGALGALVGDNASYAIGRFSGVCRVERVKDKLEWARRQLDRRGGTLVVTSRFIPGGRTATTFTAGSVHFPWLRKFLPFTVVAAVAWALYSALLGYFGGRVFEENPLYALLLASGIAIVVFVGSEGLRRFRER